MPNSPLCRPDETINSLGPEAAPRSLGQGKTGVILLLTSLSVRAASHLLKQISWRLSGSARFRRPPPSHAQLGLSFAFVHWCADVLAAVGGLLGGLAGLVDLAAYSVMHELQLCQRITSVAPWRCLLTPLPHPCLDTSGCLTIRSVSPIYKRANACGWIDLC